MKNIIKYTFVLLLIAGISSGCENFLTPSVDQNKPTETAIGNVQDLQSTVYGVYDDLNKVELYGRDYMVSLEVQGDNAFSNGNSGRFDSDTDAINYTVNSGYALGVWEQFYQAIATANVAINADLESSTEVDHWKGQAYAARAFSHMNLLMAFGQQYVNGGDASKGVPYVTTYNNNENFYPSRTAIAEVKTKIEEDLNTAIDLLDADREHKATQLDYWGTKALQTRFYLYTEQYQKVVSPAEEIINSGNFGIVGPNNLEAEWRSGSGPVSLFELAFTSTDRLGTDNIARIYRPTNYGDVEVTPDLYNAHASDDVRLDLYGKPGDIVVSDGAPQELAGYRIIDKYTDEQGSDNVRVIRYAEVVLNYAEALVNGASGQMTAKEAIDMIADKRYENGSPYTTVTVDDVLKERRLELAMEGHRFYDLARTGRDITAGGSVGLQDAPIPYGDYRYALPIPDNEINANSNVTQNKGYK